MADRRRGESKQLKKDQTIRRETLDDLLATDVGALDEEHGVGEHRG